MLSFAKRVMSKYKIFLLQMALDRPTNYQAKFKTCVTSKFAWTCLHPTPIGIYACFD